MSTWVDDLPTEGHWVYHLCGVLPNVDPREELEDIYVGVTSNLRQRIRSHSRKWWFVAVVRDLSEFIEVPTRQQAEALERDLIRLYEPAINIVGLIKAPRSGLRSLVDGC